jgi:hypothetical protein
LIKSGEIAARGALMAARRNSAARSWTGTIRRGGRRASVCLAPPGEIQNVYGQARRKMHQGEVTVHFITHGTNGRGRVSGADKYNGCRYLQAIKEVCEELGIASG